MQEMDKVGKKTSQGSEDTPNKCMTQYISRTINKAIFPELILLVPSLSNSPA